MFGNNVLFTENVPLVAVEATAAERLSQTVLSLEPCSLKVILALEDKAQVVRSNCIELIAIAFARLTLYNSLFTQSKAPLNAP